MTYSPWWSSPKGILTQAQGRTSKQASAEQPCERVTNMGLAEREETEWWPGSLCSRSLIGAECAVWLHNTNTSCCAALGNLVILCTPRGHLHTPMWQGSFSQCSFLIFIFRDGSHHVAQADIELEILLPQPSKFWDYRWPPPCLALMWSLDALSD